MSMGHHGCIRPSPMADLSSQWLAFVSDAEANAAERIALLALSGALAGTSMKPFR